MNQFTENACAVVLAAGKGTRMKSESPKVASLLSGKALIVHVLNHLRSAGIQRILVIVGYKKDEVISLCSGFEGIEFAEQTEQLGTGHALLCAEKSLSTFQGTLVVACGDVPLISPASFRSLLDMHSRNGNEVTVLSAEIENPFGYGRIIRADGDKLHKIVEEKDASDEDRKVSEINTGTYCFNSPGVFARLKRIGNNNKQKEYYLPDLVRIANEDGKKTGALKLLNSMESSGVNSPEDLESLHDSIQKGKIAV